MWCSCDTITVFVLLSYCVSTVLLTPRYRVVLRRYFPSPTTTASQARPTSCGRLYPVIRRGLDVLRGGPRRPSDPDPHAAPASRQLLRDDDLAVVHTGPGLVGLVVLVAGPGQSVAALEGR